MDGNKVLGNKLGLISSADLAREEERVSKKKAVELFESGMLNKLEAGSFSSLKAIHKCLFDKIYDFAGETRTVNISKGNFRFAPLMYLEAALANAVEVVIRLNEIVHLDRLKANGHLAFLIDLLHLREHEPVACQTVGAVAEVDLYVIVETMVDLLGTLMLQLLHKLGDCGCFLFLSCWTCCAFRHKPSAFFLNCAGDSAVATVPANHLLGGIP